MKTFKRPYARLVKMLKALPKKKQQFCGAAYKDEKGLCCVIGTLCPSTQALGDNKVTAHILFDGLYSKNDLDIKLLKKVKTELNNLGLNADEVKQVQQTNDFPDMGDDPSPKERFKAVLEFLEDKAKNEK